MKPLSHENFIEHLTKSSTASKLGINNELPADLKENVEMLYQDYIMLCEHILPSGIYITSGYRCSALNKAVGGVPGSKHCSARAFDFAFVNCVSKTDFYQLFEQMRKNFMYYMSKNNPKCSSTALGDFFRRHFIAYPNRLFVHYQL